MKKIHNMKNLILCILLIGVLCATTCMGGIVTYAEESSTDSGLAVADGLVDAVPETDSSAEGETSNIQDEPTSGEVEQASSDARVSSEESEDEERLNVAASSEEQSSTSSTSSALSEEDDEVETEESEPNYYEKINDEEIRITAEIEAPDGEKKIADPDTLVEAPRIDDPDNQYDTIGDGVNYLVTIPKRLGFIEKGDGSYESDRTFTVWSNLNDDQMMVVSVSGDGTDNVILRDHRGTGEAIREVIPYMVDLNWDASRSLGDRISTSGGTVSITGAGEFTARSKLVAADGEAIGAGRWAGPMVFSVEILPGLTEEQQAAAAEYAQTHPEFQ